MSQAEIIRNSFPTQEIVMAFDKVKPYRGRVWFDGGGNKVMARVVGSWNGWAVAEMSVAAAKRLFKGVSKTEVKGSNFVIRTEEMGTTDTVPIRNGVVHLGDGWSLYAERIIPKVAKRRSTSHRRSRKTNRRPSRVSRR